MEFRKRGKSRKVQGVARTITGSHVRLLGKTLMRRQKRRDKGFRDRETDHGDMFL